MKISYFCDRAQSNTPMDQPKIERMLRLMQLLTGNINYTLDEISGKLGISRRSVFRYLDTFKAAGFSIQRIGEGVYRMATFTPGHIDLAKIVYFSKEEACVVSHLIESLDNTNAMKIGLKRKLAAIYDSTSIGNYITHPGNSAAIEALTYAIKQKRRVVLHAYASSHSGSVSDYLVEPYRFNTNYIDVWAYDISDCTNKRFKVARIGSVDVLDVPWANESHHEEIPMDSFRIHGHVIERVKLRMDLVAKNLLEEEYPLTMNEIVSDGKTWLWEGDIRGMEGAGRFVLGLHDHVTILEGNKLKEWFTTTIEGLYTHLY